MQISICQYDQENDVCRRNLDRRKIEQLDPDTARRMQHDLAGALDRVEALVAILGSDKPLDEATKKRFATKLEEALKILRQETQLQQQVYQLLMDEC